MPFPLPNNPSRAHSPPCSLFERQVLITDNPSQEPGKSQVACSPSFVPNSTFLPRATHWAFTPFYSLRKDASNPTSTTSPELVQAQVA